MRKFNLPLVAANLSVDTALKTAIDAKRSGVVLKTKSGGLRLVHYEDLVGASKKKIPLSKVDFVPILDMARTRKAGLVFDAVKSAGLKIGYSGVSGSDIANLLVLGGTLAKGYVSASTGTRCTRPGKPPGRPDRKWYHYYPPEDRDAAAPDICTICSAKLL
ncbi:hypothetical protein [Bradyrhizobium erythrophlei]|jgi:hypothetical protein|uniref:Uncharacterized protein n=1 Tax=Bradyrhizobium erythrophlei TaxID=1437360 RepID=A0A1M5LY45_9BRAD|nr:hypothetical protein [Bradyrhizobium erythrophlei]SHG70034.1 hypothetical protein SAMN05444169_3727 [Bradyrhizobium erythrophlei]